jgi:hypothetical protein
MGKKILTFVFLFPFSVSSTVVMRAVDCPDQFEGRVKAVMEPFGPSHVFSMNKVIFENHRLIKGNVPEQVSLDILQNGPFKFETQKDYRVQLRNGKVCWIEEL